MNLNFFNILIICGTVQGFIFSSYLIFSKKYNSKPYRYIAYLILTISLSNLDYWFRDTNLSLKWENYFFTYIPFDLLILPIYFYFVSSYLEINKKFAKYLFIPFIIRYSVQIFCIVYYSFLVDFFVISPCLIYILERIDEYASISFMFVNVYLLFQLVKGYENDRTILIRKSTKWIKQLIYFGIGLCVFWIMVVLIDDVFPKLLITRKKYYIIWLGLSVLIYWIGYLSVYHLGVLNQRKKIRHQQHKNSNKIEEIIKNKTNDRFNEIDFKIKSEKLYTNNELSLQMLSEMFNLSEGYLSQLINNNTQTNFSSYINNLRIEEAKSILVNPEFSNYTIVAIALESGFNSKSAFYNAFKKSTGISPQEHKNRNMS